MSLDVGTKLGSYEVLSPIGAGGMGEVYRARFTRDAQVLAALNHPNIATIHGIEESGGLHALVMELIEGPTLDERIAGRPVPISEALALAAQIADALDAAHEKGMLREYRASTRCEYP